MNCNKEPEYLSNGDSIGLISTARKISLKEIEYAIEILQKWSLNVVTSKNLFRQHNQFSGTDEERAHDLQDMINNKNIKAILCVRGGYGTVRILDLIDFSILLKNPKWIIGYSDVTALHSRLNNLGVCSIHATMPINFKDNTKESLKSLRKILFGEKLYYAFNKSNLNINGIAKGQIIGGNLSVLYSVMGSNAELKTKNKILIIEDLDEYLYHIDRVMMALKRSNKLKYLSGLIVGSMTKMHDNKIKFGKNAHEIIFDCVKEYNYPVAFNFPLGHIKNNLAVILGKKVKLSVKKDCKLEYI